MRTLAIALTGLTVPLTVLASRVISRDITAFLDRGVVHLDWTGGSDGSPPLETGVGLSGAVAILLSPTDSKAAATALFVGWFGLIAIVDHRHGVVPDRLVFPALWTGLIFAASGVAAVTPTAAISGAAGALLGITAIRALAACLLASRRLLQLGDGDVKLGAALGAWQGALPALAAFAVAAAVLAIAAAVCGKAGAPMRRPFAPAFCFTALCFFGLQPFCSFDLGMRP